MAMPLSLPDELIFEIFTRLPVKSLLVFRSISKQFRYLIDDPDFIHQHLQYQYSNHQKLIFESSHQKPSLVVLDFLTDDNHKCFDLGLPTQKLKFFVIGSCDGLVALLDNAGIFLWNISTRKQLILPNIFQGCADYVRDSDEDFLPCGGFGRGATTDDYKLFIVEHCVSKSTSRAAVYSLKSNCWKMIDNVSAATLFLTTAVHVAGTLYWWGDLNESFNMVVGFDLDKESFFEVPYADKFDEPYNDKYDDPEATVIRQVVDFGGRVGVFCVYGHKFCVCGLYVSGSEYSWIKLLEDELPLGSPKHCPLFKPFVHLNNVDVYFVDEEQLVVKYDFNEKTMEIFKVIEDLELVVRDTSTYFTYVDSLVSPN